MWRGELIIGPQAIFALPEIIEYHGILRAKELREYGIAHPWLSRLVQSRCSARVSRGLYALPHDQPSLLAMVAKRVNLGVVCLRSALEFHGLEPDEASQLWIAIGPKSRRPRLDFRGVQIVHFSGLSLTEGIHTHLLPEKIPVCVYGVAKTVVDCFKFRRKVGLELAVRALRWALDRRLCSVDEVRRFAVICRVSTIVERYLEPSRL